MVGAGNLVLGGGLVDAPRLPPQELREQPVHGRGPVQALLRPDVSDVVPRSVALDLRQLVQERVEIPGGELELAVHFHGALEELENARRQVEQASDVIAGLDRRNPSEELNASLRDSDRVVVKTVQGRDGIFVAAKMGHVLHRGVVQAGMERGQLLFRADRV